eukprot:tig00000480_g1336.t1
MTGHQRGGRSRRDEDDQEERDREEEMLNALREDGLSMREIETRAAARPGQSPDALEEELDYRIRNDDCVLEADIADARQAQEEDLDERRIREQIEREVEENLNSSSATGPAQRVTAQHEVEVLSAQAEELRLQEALDAELDDRIRDEVDGRTRGPAAEDDDEEERFALELQASIAENAVMERIDERRASEATAALLSLRQNESRPPPPPMRSVPVVAPAK